MSNRDVKRLTAKKQAPWHSRLMSVITGFWVVLTGVTTIIGFLSVAFFSPRITVTASEPSDPERPLSSAITVANINITPLSDLRIGIAPGDVLVGKQEIESSEQLDENSSYFFRPDWDHHYLGRDEQFSISPAEIFDISTTKADLAVNVSFRVWCWPKRIVRAFRLTAHPEPNGHYRWYSRPLR